MFKNVTREQKLLLLSTFVVGAVSGAYLYLTVYAPAYREGFFPDLPDTLSEDDVSVRAVQYGDCISSGFTCPSYELAVDGWLFTSPPTDLQAEAVVHETRLGNQTRSVLYNAITKAPLVEYGMESSSANCTSEKGNHYRYVIFRGEENFIIDTCRTNFPAESDLATVLKTFFEVEPVLE